MSKIVIMQNDSPVGVMNDLCFIKFHSFVKVFCVENKFTSVPSFVPQRTIYECTSNDGKSIYFKAVEVEVIR